MGLIVSRFRRKKTTSDELEKLDRDIRSLEQRGQWTELQHRKIISTMTIYSVGIYFWFAIAYYFLYTGKSVSWTQSLSYATPFLIMPLLVLFLRKGITWYYDRKLSKDRIRLSRMRDEKKKLLEEVMNTETYKVAKELIEKYGDPETRSRELRQFVPTTNVPGNTTPTATPGQIRQRQLALPSTPTSSITPYNNNNVSFTNNIPRTPLRPDQLPHPLVPSQQTTLDRVLNFFLNDGPNKRFALICNSCMSHNGMVLEELYDYTSFKCAYCGKLNPSRKQRPRAPPLAITPAKHDLPVLTNASIRVMDQPSSESDSEEENNSAGTESDAGAQSPISPKTPDEKKQD